MTIPVVQLSVIMVTYNSSKVIPQSLIPLMGYPEIEIVVVDNNSTDGTLDWLDQYSSEINLVVNRDNVGFAKAVNRGVSESIGETIMLLNPDAVVTVDAVKQLLMTLAQHDRTAVVAPLIEHPLGRLKIMSAGRFPTSWRMFTHYFGISRLSNSRWAQGHYLLLRNKHSPEIDVDWVTGACFVVSRDHWSAVGGLSERWFMYAEDVEFCFKIKRLGLDIKVDTLSAATHLVGESDSTISSKVNSAWVVNLYDFYKMNLSKSQRSNLMWALVVSLGMLSRALVFRVRATLSSGQTALLWKKESRKFLFYSNAVCATVWTHEKKTS